MRFDPDAEGGEFDLVAQEVSVLVEAEESKPVARLQARKMFASMLHIFGCWLPGMALERRSETFPRAWLWVLVPASWWSNRAWGHWPA